MAGRAATASAALLAWGLSGCGATAHDDAARELQQHVDTLLAGRVSTTVPASRLTGFRWQRLCFQRGEALVLAFEGSAPPVTLRLPFDAYFIAEAYVPQSPDGRCVGRDDRLVVTRRYPQKAATVEFRLPR